MKCSLYDYCVERNEEHLLTQWHSEKNLPLSPETISFGSSKKVWWQCNKGHEWQAVVFSRTGDKSGCPVCKNRIIVKGQDDLAAVYPEIAEQWHPTKNAALKPADVFAGTRKKSGGSTSVGMMRTYIIVLLRRAMRLSSVLLLMNRLL